MQDALITAKSNLLAARFADTVARKSYHASLGRLHQTEATIGYHDVARRNGFVTSATDADLRRTDPKGFALLETARLDAAHAATAHRNARSAVVGARTAVDVAAAGIELSATNVSLAPAAPHCAVRLPKAGLVLVEIASRRVLGIIRKSGHEKYTHVSVYQYPDGRVVGFPHRRADLAAKACAAGIYGARGISHSLVFEVA
jgi:hypothetical protein